MNFCWLSLNIPETLSLGVAIELFHIYTVTNIKSCCDPKYPNTVDHYFLVNKFVLLDGQSFASPTPSAFMANMASASGRQGES